MNNTPETDIHGAKQALDDGDTIFVDVRDPHAYAMAHIAGALHLSDTNVADFVATTEKTQSIVVYCYHGNSSKAATHYLKSQGFENVLSMAGGFEAWRHSYPSEPTSE
jgi:thiosulfate sulfurtransferase